MRNRETYFEQVPIETVEAILRRDAAQARVPEESTAATGAPDRRAVEEFGTQETSRWSKGPQ